MSTSVNQCPNGHFYHKTLQNCPFCSTRADLSSTQTVPATDYPPSGGSGDSGERTQIMGGGSSGGHAGADPTVKLSPNSHLGSRPMPDDSDRTIIQRPAPKATDGAKDDGATTKDAPAPSTSTRKLVGWLVSFSHDPFGTDYRLYEGQNKVGRDATCSVRIVHDKSISSNHATILFRNGNFYVKDEMAANPSFVNKIEIKPGATEEIKDGDTIDFGGTTLLFRKAFI